MPIFDTCQLKNCLVPVKCTVWENETGLVGKEYITNRDGSTGTILHGDITRGTYQVISPTSVRELLDLRTRYGASGRHCFTYGTPRAESGRFVTKPERQANPGTIARCREDLSFPEGEPGWFFGDIDLNGVNPRILRDKKIPLHWKGLEDIIRKVWPEFRDICHGWTLGNSACLYDELTGGERKGLGSYRLLFPVDNAAKLPLVMARLYSGLWKAGYGFIKIITDRKGNPRLHDKSLIDSCTIQPEREDFLAPILRPGCGIVRTMPQGLPFIDGSKLLLETAALPDIGDVKTWRKSSREIADAKLKLKPECDALKAKAFKIDLPNLLKDNPGTSEEELRDQYWDDVDAGKLPRHYPLELEDGTPIDAENVVVLAVMFNSAINLRDPTDPNYDGGRQVAQAYYNEDTNTAYIFTFARGEETFDVTDVLRKLQMEGQLPAPVHCSTLHKSPPAGLLGALATAPAMGGTMTKAVMRPARKSTMKAISSTS